MFEITETDEESMAVMDWVFPGCAQGFSRIPTVLRPPAVAGRAADTAHYVSQAGNLSAYLAQGRQGRAQA